MTIKLKDFANKYGDLEINEKELKELLGIKDKKAFIPEMDEVYWFVSTDGFIDFNFFGNLSSDNKILNHNIVYRTEEEAEFARDKRAFLIKMERDFAENSDEIDWGNRYQNKYFVGCGHVSELIRIEDNVSLQVNVPYTTNKEWLERYIKDNESYIKKYVFGVKEKENETE